MIILSVIVHFMAVTILSHGRMLLGLDVHKLLILLSTRCQRGCGMITAYQKGTTAADGFYNQEFDYFVMDWLFIRLLFLVCVYS